MDGWRFGLLVCFSETTETIIQELKDLFETGRLVRAGHRRNRAREKKI